GVYNVVLTGSGQATLYVKVGSQPTPTNYDCISNSVSPSQQCQVTLPTSGVIFLRVTGIAQNTTFTLTTLPGPMQTGYQQPSWPGMTVQGTVSANQTANYQTPMLNPGQYQIALN